MSEHLPPGVFIQESNPGNQPIEAAATSTVGFLGIAERGPTAPTLLTSFNEYHGTFGGYVLDGTQDRYLTYAIEGYFLNGGRRCYVQRVVAKGATTAVTTLDAKLKVAALGSGLWGNRVAVGVAPSALTQFFRLTVRFWAPGVPWSDEPTVQEAYDNLSTDEASTDFYEKRVNGASRLVTIARTDVGGRPADVTSVWLTGGSDGQAYAENDFTAALDCFAKLKDITMLCCPEESLVPRITGQILDQCELLKDRFAILQAPLLVRDLMAHRPPRDSRYGAYYLPWLRIRHAETGTEKLIPPGGHIAGIYARVDRERGAHKAPANEAVRGLLTDPLDPARGLAVLVTTAQQEGLNSRGVNVLRYFPGRGSLLWGARTMASDPEWKYVNVRRLVIFIEASMKKGTRWVVFEPNDEALWARVRSSVSNFLTGLWKDGMLQGQKPEQAFFVKCDRTTMTQSDLDQGRLVMVIGIAPIKPAEFVIFKIGQWAGGSEVTD
ncbi:MAG: phage tail sheath C-terminal domain-containing protein [Nitrospira sp.]